ncbi:MAG: exodeoxyribonuclease V subunit gamma [Methylococcaceae bacterium]
MIHLYQSNQLEILSETLAKLLINKPLTSVFQPDVILVQSQGMGRWLSLELASKQGVCSNFLFELPAAYLWRQICQQLPLNGEQQPTAFSEETLVWKILRWLQQSENLSKEPKLQHYLKDKPIEQWFELSIRIAQVFDQYLVYRPDMIKAWSDGQLLNSHPDEAWQAHIWRAMVVAANVPDRVTLMYQLAALLGQDAELSFKEERVIIFGVSSLPPIFIQLLSALSRHLPVHLLALNPCQHDWSQIKDLVEADRLTGQNDPNDLHLEMGHPLLASFGKQGREFFDLLRMDDELIEDNLFKPAVGKGSMLDVLQQDILKLVERTDTGQVTVASDDDSVQLHLCHSPMREMEVLKDQVLSFLDRLEGLTPADIVVLAPDISLYAPFVEAVFSPKQGENNIPFYLADQSLSAEQPLLERFMSLLDLADSRFEVEWVMDLLSQPAVLRRFGLQDSDRTTLQQWVSECHVCWARDAAHKASQDLPANEQHSWLMGLRRMVLGYAMPASLADKQLPVFANIAPYDNIEGQQIQVLNGLLNFFETLVKFSSLFRRTLTITAWIDHLNQLVDAFFAATDSDWEAIQAIREMLDDLKNQTASAEFVGSVPLSLVKAALQKQIEKPSGSSGFLMGGVTFCNLVPMRSLPFRVICLVGMNDEDFPRQQLHAGFDLMGKDFRPGDRSRRTDDRYLFLETVLACREVLYISYIGRSIRDDTVLTPSVLVTELMDVIGQSCYQDNQPLVECIQTCHPLQAFSPRYFSGIELPSYSKLWCRASQALIGQSNSSSSAKFFSEPLPEADDTFRQIDINDLMAFYSNPCRYLLKTRLNIHLEHFQHKLENREPFTLNNLTSSIVRQKIYGAIFHKATQKSDSEQEILNWVSAEGLLPQGAMGELAFQQNFEVVKNIESRIAEIISDESVELTVFFKLEGIALSGQLSVFPDRGIVDVHLNNVQPQQIFALWIKHLLLCMLTPKDIPLASQLIGKDKTVTFAAATNPQALLGDLLTGYWSGMHFPLLFFSKSSFLYAQKMLMKSDPVQATESARKSWFGDAFSFAEGSNPYYQCVYRDYDPIDERFAQLTQQLCDPMLQVLTEQKV